MLGVLRLTTRKPSAIDPDYFTPVSRPLYLTDMAVAPRHQGKEVGRWLLARALKLAVDWPADAVRLDAYDADAGGGGFYERCGFREVGRCQYRGTPLIYYETLVDPRP